MPTKGYKKCYLEPTTYQLVMGRKHPKQVFDGIILEMLETIETQSESVVKWSQKADKLQRDLNDLQSRYDSLDSLVKTLLQRLSEYEDTNGWNKLINNG